MKIIAMIPTYNERDNITSVVTGVLALVPSVEVLVVDDDSPDGTWRAAEEISLQNPRVRVLKRTSKRGRGFAGAAGFAKALEMGADVVVEMDGDGSHAPEFIPAIVSALENADIAVGSRYMRGGTDSERSVFRRFVSFCARKYLAAVTGAAISDPTSGFRAYRRAALEKILPHLKADDPFIVTEVVFYSKKLGLAIKDVPIEFRKRLSGESKLKPATLMKYLLKAWKLRFENF